MVNETHLEQLSHPARIRVIDRPRIPKSFHQDDRLPESPLARRDGGVYWVWTGVSSISVLRPEESTEELSEDRSLARARRPGHDDRVLTTPGGRARKVEVLGQEPVERVLPDVRQRDKDVSTSINCTRWKSRRKAMDRKKGESDWSGIEEGALTRHPHWAPYGTRPVYPDS